MENTNKLKVFNQPLLTIAIPTYNRSSFLDLCLKRIGEELHSLSTDRRKLVKVYVSNNASTDNTCEIISRNQSAISDHFEVANNVENIGADRNIVQCYTSATTPYVWILGDDDVILQGGLKVVLDALDKQDLDVLYVNGYGYSDNYLDEPKRGRGKRGLKKYSSALSFVKRTHVMLTFITALVVRSGVNAGSDNRVLDGTKLLHFGWVLPLIRDGKKFAIIEDRIYAAKLDNGSFETGNLGNSGGYGAINIFGKDLSNIANSILKNRRELAKALQNGAVVTWFPIYLLNLRKGKFGGFVQEEVVTELRRLYGGNWRYLFFLIPLMSLPLKFAQTYFYLIRLARLLLGNSLI